MWSQTPRIIVTKLEKELVVKPTKDFSSHLHFLKNSNQKKLVVEGVSKKPLVFVNHRRIPFQSHYVPFDGYHRSLMIHQWCVTKALKFDGDAERSPFLWVSFKETSSVDLKSIDKFGMFLGRSLTEQIQTAIHTNSIKTYHMKMLDELEKVDHAFSPKGMFRWLNDLVCERSP